MTTVLHNNVKTEHETTLDLCARLAACCTFYYADTRDAMRKQGRVWSGICEAWLVFSASSDTWRVCDPQSWIEDDEEILTYTKSEGETARELLKLIDNPNDAESARRDRGLPAHDGTTR